MLAGLMASLLAEGNGSFSGAFLRIGLGARGMAMGNAQVATADHGYGAYYNPAALPNLDRKRFSASYSAMSLDRKFNYLGLAVPLKGIAGVSAGWINSGVGDIRAYNSVGQDVGALDHSLNAFYFSFGANVIALAQADSQLMHLRPDLISIGVTVKFLKENLDDNEEFNYSGDGLGVDVGVLIRPFRNLTLGYQIKDVNARLKSNTDNIFDRGLQLDNPFPVSQRVGFFYRLPVKWAAVAYDFEWSTKGEEKHHVGVELKSRLAAARLGYDTNRVTFGGGLLFRAFRKTYMTLDYAFLSSVVDEGGSHVFSWQFLF
ncbi:MAG: hypothetical protein D6681_14690 [Calditrichaeota bacterium]|nr:MAG: hypothetical protein D6681_14690 [Calditrichota bacterium]